MSHVGRKQAKAEKAAEICDHLRELTENRIEDAMAAQTVAAVFRNKALE